MTSRRFLLPALVVSTTTILCAVPDAPDANEPQNDSQADTPTLTNIKPLVKWTFDEPVPRDVAGKPKIERRVRSSRCFPICQGQQGGVLLRQGFVRSP